MVVAAAFPTTEEGVGVGATFAGGATIVATGCGRVAEAAGITCCNCCVSSWLPPVKKRN
jgi:hypothetical protein